MFYESLVSDWNHGNAHFLRGVVAELQARGHEVVVYEPREGWSRTQLLKEQGPEPLAAFARRFPELSSRLYDIGTLDLEAALSGADVVMVHEWNDPALVRALGARRATGGRFLLFFHDTHHRAVTDPDALARFDLGAYDAVLAFGEILRQVYLAHHWCRRAYTWHEAADTRVFHPPETPIPEAEKRDLVWIGNGGDGDRTAELEELLVAPVRALGLSATAHGVRYSEEMRRSLAQAGIRFGGWVPNFDVPTTFARFRTTVHIPRRPYARSLPGIPTIRPFEALACGIPLVSAPWDDREGLFKVGRDYLVARDAREMQEQLAWLLANPDEAAALAADGRRTVQERHTCAHRVDELLGLVTELSAGVATVGPIVRRRGAA